MKRKKNPKTKRPTRQKNPTPTELKASPFPRYGAISYAAMTLFETCREGQAGAESQMTPRCYLLSSNGGKGRLWWGGRIMQALVSIEAWLCLARKWGCGTVSPTDPSGLELLPAAPCRHCVSIGVGARWELGVCVQLLPSVLIPVCAGAAVEGWGSCRNVLVELYKLMLHCSSMQGPAAGFEQADQSPCSTISLHNHPQGPKAAPAPCQAALSSLRSIFIVSPVHRRGPRSPHFCVDKCIQCIRMAVALLLYVKSI